MINADYKSIEKLVLNTLTQFSSVSVGYIFGSVVTGRAGPMSDVDVAVLLESSESATETNGLIQDALCRVLKTDSIDLISLTEAPPPLAYRIIRDGRCIYCRDNQRREGFESDTVMRYLDFKPVRERAFQTSRERILEAV